MIFPFINPKRDIFWVHEVLPNKPRYQRFFRWLERHLYCFVAVSHAVAGSLLRLGIAEERIHVIHNGIMDPASAGLGAENDDERLIVGIAGQIGAWKGHDDLLEAFALIVPTYPLAQLHIFGKGSSDYENHLREKANSLAISDNVVWRGFVVERQDIYRNMDVCVVPSRSEEPLGIVAIEAAFFSIPVIATKRGGLPEIVKDSKTGFLVEAERPRELASKLKALVNDAGLRAEMGGHARSRALKKFNRDRFIKDFISLLHQGNPSWNR
jgi:glycosyltransferase involved in cell wall biosynthesis